MWESIFKSSRRISQAIPSKTAAHAKTGSFGSRIHCATECWHGMTEALENYLERADDIPENMQHKKEIA